MRVTAHFLLHSALLFSRLWSAHSAVVYRGLIRPAEGYHCSTALADRADASAGAQGSTLVPEPDLFHSATGIKHSAARARAAERAKRLAGNKPTSLDLTFHMLRELMETSRAERMSQKAKLNKHLLKTLGKRSELE